MECDYDDHERWLCHGVNALELTKNFLKNVADVTPHCAKVVMLSIYMMNAPCLPLSI